MKAKLFVTIITSLVISWDTNAQTYPMHDYRYTEIGSLPVPVVRLPNPYYYSGSGPKSRDVQTLEDFESAALHVYKDGTLTLLKSGEQWQYQRNCHDFTFGPYMSCMCSTPGTQTEAWFMIDPTLNWVGHDHSLVPYYSLLSIHYPSLVVNDYLFTTSVLNNLQYQYYDVLGNLIPLPAAPVGGTAGDKPWHSALLLGWLVQPQAPQYSAGIFESKWGLLGVFQHRWGVGHLPDGTVPGLGSYIQPGARLQIFVPNAGWPFSPRPI